MANAQSKAAAGRTKCTVLLEVVADLVKRPYGRLPASEKRFFEVAEVAELLRDLQVAIGQGRKEYYLGAIVVERRADGSLRLLDGCKRLAAMSVMLEVIRGRLSGAKPKRRRGPARESMQCIDTFFDDLIKQRSTSTRTRLLRGGLTFVERRVMVATVTVPSEVFMQPFRTLSSPREVDGDWADLTG